MSTPVSLSNNAGLLGALTNPQNASTNANTTQASQTGMTMDGASQAALTLISGLQLETATASVSQLSQAFDQAAQSVTTVDPSTGVSEVSASAASQLGTALDKFLQQSGFSQQQADAASQAFVAELAQGGPANLNVSYDDTTTLGTSISASYGSQTMSASSVALNERSGSVAIEFDPATGKLSISLQEQQLSAYTSVTQVSDTGSVPLPLSTAPSPSADLLASLRKDGKGDGNDTTNGQDAASQSEASSDPNSLLNDLISGLGQPTLYGTQEALPLLSRMATLGQQQDSSASNGSQTDTATNGSQEQAASAAGTPVTMGFTQSLSISLVDLNGHGTTLFKRLDGSTGAMAFEPTDLQV